MLPRKYFNLINSIGIIEKNMLRGFTFFNGIENPMKLFKASLLAGFESFFLMFYATPVRLARLGDAHI
jgi:hypothetical protein